MRYRLTVTMDLDSDQSKDRVAKLVESLFEFGTIKESIVEGLQILDDPRLLAVEVTWLPSGERSNSGGSP